MSKTAKQEVENAPGTQVETTEQTPNDTLEDAKDCAPVYPVYDGLVLKSRYLCEHDKKLKEVRLVDVANDGEYIKLEGQQMNAIYFSWWMRREEFNQEYTVIAKI